MGLISWWKRLRGIEEVKVRARDEDGRFVADDPKTRDNEAWTLEDRKIEK